jgi:arylformamidase
MSVVYNGYSQEQLDGLLNARAMVPDNQVYTDRFSQRSSETRERFNGRLDIAYGQDPRERIDVFLPDAAFYRPTVNLFFHGGYWRSSDKERYSFIANAFNSYGAACIVVEYSLVPTVTLDELVAQCRAAVAYVYNYADELGVDRDRIHVSGHSAGGQIVGMLLASGWQHKHGLPNDVIKGGTGVSGLYDMEAIRLSYLNETLGLNASATKRNSVFMQHPASPAPFLLAVGSNEREEFLRQNTLMYRAWKAKAAVRPIVLEGLHHYSAVESLGDPNSELGLAIRQQMGL